MANSADTDQMLHSAASDLGQYCLQLRPICPNTKGYTTVYMLLVLAENRFRLLWLTDSSDPTECMNGEQRPG